MATISAPSAGAARTVPAWRRGLQTAINWIVLAVIVVGVGYFLRARAHQQVTPVAGADVPAATLSENLPDTLMLAPETVEAMHVQAVQVRQAPPNTPLKLYGSLYLEGSRLVHVQTRFPGMVVEVGDTQDASDNQIRPLKPGDKVSKGEVLAKLWSKEVGEKKTELVTAISDLHLHEAALKRYQSLAGGAVPTKTVQEAENAYREDKIRIESLKRTLRSWQIQEDELASIEAEARRVIAESLIHNNPSQQRQLPPSATVTDKLTLDRTWAELDIVAPMSGVIMEKNFTVGDIVDTSRDMFKIADLSRLGVMANVYEEDLPKLVALKPEERRWEVELLAEPGLKPRQGRFESIGNVLDPMQHTAIVKGWLDNPDAQLRVGQFVTVTVELPNRAGLVMVPTSSLVDDGSRTYVFVTDRKRSHFTRREVKISRRGAVMAQLESQPQA
ncbi:MAG: efflux RND transporter periplasmic adaptor subunit, partial [Planctomycetia bacterium]|nr:efflux RND transporter periplasmic adaptor subunit [Planctomycetia bacterium]